MKRQHGILILALVVAVCGCQSSHKKDKATQQNVVKQEADSVSDKEAEPKGQPSGPGQEAPTQAGTEQDFQPFNVYIDKGTRDNHYVPSGFMGDVECVTFNDAWQDNCQQGSSCIKIIYDIDCSRQNRQWVGVYWLDPPNNWGDTDGGYDLTGASKLVFWARGEVGGEQIMEVTVGGIGNDYPDSDIAVIGPIILGQEWKKYTIDLRGKDLSSISGGFSWSTSVEVNPIDCTFYLDNIRFE
jgi:hypothetical protein